MEHIRPSIFVVSSSENLEICEAIQMLLHHDCEVIPWTTVCTPGEQTTVQLARMLQEVDFAIVVAGGNDVLVSRGKKTRAPRDNVLMELGLAIGALGLERTFLVFDQTAKPKLPSDYDGITAVTYFPPQRGTYESALGAACARIKRVIARFGCRRVCAHA
jgi:predicted nucleotide-binding protein